MGTQGRRKRGGGLRAKASPLPSTQGGWGRARIALMDFLERVVIAPKPPSPLARKGPARRRKPFLIA